MQVLQVQVSFDTGRRELEQAVDLVLAGLRRRGWGCGWGWGGVWVCVCVGFGQDASVSFFVPLDAGQSVFVGLHHSIEGTGEEDARRRAQRRGEGSRRRVRQGGTRAGRR